MNIIEEIQQSFKKHFMNKKKMGLKSLKNKKQKPVKEFPMR